MLLRFLHFHTRILFKRDSPIFMLMNIVMLFYDAAADDDDNLDFHDDGDGDDDVYDDVS